MGIFDRPLLERVKGMRRMFAGATEILVAQGWTSAAGVERCATCGGGTVWRDPAGTPRHPWCAP